MFNVVAKKPLEPEEKEMTEIQRSDYVKTTARQGSHPAGVRGKVLVITDITGRDGSKGTPALADIESETGFRMFVPLNEVTVLTAPETDTFIDDMNRGDRA